MRIEFALQYFMSSSTPVAERSAALACVEWTCARINEIGAKFRRGRSCSIVTTQRGRAFDLPHVFGPGDSDSENAQVLQALEDCLTDIDVVYLRAHPDTPRLRDTAVRYGRTTLWLPINAIYELGYADCKSLSAADRAEYILRGIHVRAVFRWSPRQPRPGAMRDFHLLNQLEDFFEDASVRHGMNTPRAVPESQLFPGV